MPAAGLLARSDAQRAVLGDDDPVLIDLVVDPRLRDVPEPLSLRSDSPRPGLGSTPGPAQRR